MNCLLRQLSDRGGRDRRSFKSLHRFVLNARIDAYAPGLTRGSAGLCPVPNEQLFKRFGYI